MNSINFTVPNMTKALTVTLMVLGMVLLGAGAYSLSISTHAQSQGTTVSITPSGGATFSNSGWAPQSFTVDTSSISSASQVVITVTGTATSDPYMRYLVLDVNGHVIQGTAVPGGESFSDGVGSYYTDVVSNSFSVQYDVTPYVTGQSSSTVLIGLTTQAGSWNVQASFVTGSSSGPGGGTVLPPADTGGYTLTWGTLLIILGIISFIGAYILHRD